MKFSLEEEEDLEDSSLEKEEDSSLEKEDDHFLEEEDACLSSWLALFSLPMRAAPLKLGVMKLGVGEAA